MQEVINNGLALAFINSTYIPVWSVNYFSNWEEENICYELWKEWRNNLLSVRQREQIFLPELTNSFLNNIIKQLKQQAYDLLLHHKTQPDWLAEISWTSWLESRHRKLCVRIRDYEWRLKGKSKGKSIGPGEILLAKQHLVGDYFQGKLRRNSKTLVGLCPFHKEKTASFTIYLDSNTFVCFGCGEKGDVIDFVMKLNNLTFMEAVKYILKN